MVIIGGSYLIGTVIGRGKYGWVSKAKHVYHNTDVAVKHTPWKVGMQCEGGKEHLDCEHAKDSSCEAFLRHEATILASIKHPAIVSLLDIISEPDAFYLCMEDLGNTSLKSFVEDKSFGKVEESEASIIFSQVVDGLHYLHLKYILHRDVKPENIMVMKKNNSHIVAKLIDLGLSVNWNKKDILNSSVSRAGTLSYMAPELMKPSTEYGSKVDVFSLGASLYFTLIGESPFQEFRRNNVRSTTAIFGLQIYHDDAIASLTSCVQQLLQCMLNCDPKLRGSLSNICSHSWFLKTNYQSI